MPSFGEKLKQEREKRKITLEQISTSTKIGTRMLQALEDDKFDQLPGGIFNKGFVRAYSRCIGLDEDQTVAEYLLASGDAPPVSTEIAARENGARENEENISRLEAISDAHPRQLPWGLLAAVLLLIALALALWTRRQREYERQAVHPTPTAAVAPLPAAQLSDEASAKMANGNSASGASTSGSPAPASPGSGAPINASSANSAGTNSQPTGEFGPAVAQRTPQSIVAVIPPATAGEFTVVIDAREESWIWTTTDGKTVSSELLSAGSERVLRGRKEIIVKAGNAGGIDFRFNGKKLDTGGKSGEVRTVTFGPGGMVPNAATPPSTP